MSAALFALVLAGQATAAPLQITIQADRPGIDVSPDLYGIFFEEINQAGDGGIYGELLRNRGMEQGTDTALPTGWKAMSGAKVSMDSSSPLNEERRHSLKVQGAGVLNEGFWGIPLRKGVTYKLTIWLKGDAPVELQLGGTTATISAPGSNWKRIEQTFKPSENDRQGKLAIVPKNGGTVWVAFASLMASDNWKGRQNGMRRDLAEHVEAMKPSFVRFPGGCYVEGAKLSQAFDWKKSVGPLEERPGSTSRFWGYPSTDGLGYHEYLQWCEDLKAAPLYVANCGMSHTEIEPISGMSRYVEDALDAIEYANGPVTTNWGALRAKNGHPKPFNLKYIEIGNENGFNWAFGGLAPYAERYRIMFDAIKKAHPEITTIADVPVPHPTEMIDEHYYMTPRWFWQNANKYDAYDRKGPKIYVGEYAVTQGSGQGNLDAALSEAAFMTGMERNSDVVKMSSYAPLFVNINNKQWNPDAIVFDASRVYGTPSYYVQALFGNNRPDQILQHTASSAMSSPPPIAGGIGLMTWNTSAEYKDIVLTTDGKQSYNSANVKPEDLTIGDGDWKVENGTISQTRIGDNLGANIKGVDLTGVKNYTLTLKARKLAGLEGFIIMLDTVGESSLHWNLGGWRNSQTAFQRDGAVVGHPSTTALIETNRWYEIKIERQGNKTRGFLDGKLVEELTETGARDFTAVAGIDHKAREIVVKIVNGSNDARSVELNIDGAKLGSKGRVITLTGPAMAAENSFQAPRNIAPITTPLTGISPKMSYRVAARSLTILRIPVSK